MSRQPGDQLALVAFMQAGNTSVYAGSWRHPATEHRYLDASYYADLGRLLERGLFDLMFFDDRLAMPGIHGGSVADAVRYGARPVKLDLSVVLGVLSQATSRIGLGATYSTTYHAPFHVARTFGTLDHLSGGRAAWNVVTSVNDREAQNFGVNQHMSPTERYDRADEFLEAVVGLWDTWEDGALVRDRASGIYADPSKVHELNYHGAHFDVRGPLTVPRSPQGHPVLLQAGSSGRGRDFAARWAELIFTGDPGIEVARNHYAEQKARIAEFGRDPGAVKICPMAYTVVGESEAHAAEREQMFLNDLVDPMASLTLLSELMNYDFSAHDLDEIVTDELVDKSTGIRGLVQNLRTHIGDTVRIRDLAGHRATLLQGPRFVGTATQVADQMEEWFMTDACDGFVLAATHLPGSFEDVVRMVVPELQRRGLYRTEYTGSTLREHLGLERSPAAPRQPAGPAHV
ncbi:LLM class flavin-dependent oxidoreductase [Streptomyces sp. NPDC001982]|uniref:LLM class flavin-dependent oxidoreductase n=1 Tax=Streptomyces sp. NPDC001982 TaxID=3154405 RepID=UPI00331CBDB8